MSRVGVDTAAGSTDPDVPGGVDARSDRVLASLFDLALLGVAVFVAWLVAAGALVALVGVSTDLGTPGADAGQAGAVARATLWVGVGVLVFWYFTYLDGATAGTVGKRVMNVSVRTADGSRPGLAATARRTAVLMLPFPPMALLDVLLGPYGFVLALFVMAVWLLVEAAVLAVGDDGQRLGDRLAGTVVVLGS